VALAVYYVQSAAGSQMTTEVKAAVTAAGHTVTTLTVDSAGDWAARNLTGQDLIWLDESLVSGNITTNESTTTLPTVICENGLWDDWLCHSGTGTSTTDSNWEAVTGAPAGLIVADPLQVWTSGHQCRRFPASGLAAGMTPVYSDTDGGTNYFLAVAESGSDATSGTFLGPRVMFGLLSTIAGGVTLTTDGSALIEAILDQYDAGSTPATVNAAVISAPVALPAPTVSADVSVSGVVIGAPTSLPAPGVTADATPTPDTVTTTTTLPAPTVEAEGNLDATVFADLVAATAAVDSPTPGAGATATTATIAGSVTAAAPTVGVVVGVSVQQPFVTLTAPQWAAAVREPKWSAALMPAGFTPPDIPATVHADTVLVTGSVPAPVIHLP
jgi:hypothetical protein